MKDLSRIATKKQIQCIHFIKDVCDVKFKGTTSKEVYDFIGKYLPKAQKLQDMEKTIGRLGMSVYSAKKTYHGNDLHGTWEETFDLRDTIAHERFKGEILRGRNSIDALCDFQTRAMIENYLQNAENEYDCDI